MSPHELNALHIVHVFAVIGLIASVFFACAGDLATRKKVMMWGGIASLVALLTGIRMWQGVYHFRGGWVIVKLVGWLVLSGLGGIGYRRREQSGLWISVALIITLVALVMVYLQPF